MARLQHISQFWHPLIMKHRLPRLNLAAIREAISLGLSDKNNEREDCDDAKPVRTSRLSPEKRSRMLADVDQGYRELHSNPQALAEETEEGRFWDETLNDPISEE